jgi:hypothetical protein
VVVVDALRSYVRRHVSPIVGMIKVWYRSDPGRRRPAGELLAQRYAPRQDAPSMVDGAAPGGGDQLGRSESLVR